MGRSMHDEISAEVAAEMYHMVRAPGHNLNYPHYWGGQDKCEHCGKTFQQVRVQDAQAEVDGLKSEIRYAQSALRKARAKLKSIRCNPVK